MGLNRVYNWEAILYQKIEEARHLTFEYGKCDCTTWTSEVIRSISDLTWEPYWKDKKEAIKLRKIKPMEEYVSEVLGDPIGNIMKTQRGDVVQKDLGKDAAMGICIGKDVVFLMEEGICYIDLADCHYSWRI